MTSRARLLSGLLTVVVASSALAYMIKTGFEEGVTRAVMANEVTDNFDHYANERISVNGFIVKGSMRQSPDLKVLKFQVWSPGAEASHVVNVEFGKILPDTVKDGGKVSATGKLARRGDRFVFEAGEVIGKCPTKYDPMQQQVEVPTFDKSTAGELP
jgi:cytochrome c-type biogenesis protein CcmE